MSDTYEVFALRYGTRENRTRADSFIMDDDHASPHPIDYFVWVIRNADRTIVVDTGYDEAEGRRRNRPVFQSPARCLVDFGIDPESVETVIITHLHYDHAGTLNAFPNAMFHLQPTEMAYATGPCMCHDHLRAPFTADHICDMVRKIYSGKVIFHDGDAQVAPGVTVHAIGGHSLGLQSVRVKTANGHLVVASDASHFYENFLTGKVFPIVVDVAQKLDGFETIKQLASSIDLVVPGHDPLVCDLFPKIAGADETGVFRLDVGPSRRIADLYG